MSDDLIIPDYGGSGPGEPNGPPPSEPGAPPPTDSGLMTSELTFGEVGVKQGETDRGFRGLT